MNRLSWLIYWADALPSVAAAVCVFSFLAFWASVALMALFLCGSEETTGVDKDGLKTNRSYNSVDYKYTDFARSCQKLWWSKLLVPLFAVLWFGSFLVPDKETFYMIAASEAGEEAVNTPEFNKVRKVINKWLDDQVAAPAKEST